MDDFLRPTRAEADRDAHEDRLEAEARARRFQAEARPVTIRCAHCKGRHGSVAEVAECRDAIAHGEEEARADAEAAHAEEVAYARSREAQAEMGTWFGPQTEADSWGEDDDALDAERARADAARRADSQWSWDYQNRWGRAEND